MGHDTVFLDTDSLSASEPSPILTDANVPSCHKGTSTAINLVMRLLMPQENFCRLTPGPMMPFEWPCTPRTLVLHSPCRAQALSHLVLHGPCRASALLHQSTAKPQKPPAWEEPTLLPQEMTHTAL
eukprot:superscaffoldBa00006348_g21425